MRPLKITFAWVLAVVTLYLCILGGEAGENLALGKPAWQSSMRRVGTKPYAYKAVDGNSDSNFKGSSCTLTKQDQAMPWWVVDLGDSHHVSSVTITNRGDCCAEQLHDFNIALMSSPPRKVTPAPGVYDIIYHQADALGAGETRTFSTDGSLSGRYLVIQLLGDSDQLSLCEVEVYEEEVGCEKVTEENIAFEKPVWQSSTSTHDNVAQEAAHAVDGYTKNDISKGSCAQTEDTAMPWWVVDMGDVYRVSSVTITNRDGFGLQDFNIGLMSSSPDEVTPASDVYDVIYHQTEIMAKGETVTLASNDDTMSGRYLVIQLLGDTEPLSICEVQVFGYHCDENLAVGKPAWQSTTYTRENINKGAEFAVDGNFDGDFMQGGSCSVTDNAAMSWWAVDLGDVYCVSSVIISTVECVGCGFPSDFNIGLMLSSPDEVTPAPEVYDVIYHRTDALPPGAVVRLASDDDTLYGRYLVIQSIKQQYLTLCEVSVVGYHCDSTPEER